MPDDDRIPQSLTGRWRRVLKALQAGEPQNEIAYHVARATAETLRRVRGVPDLPALGARMHRAASAGSGLAESGPAGNPRHIPTRMAARAADALSVVMKGELALVSPDSAALMLARRLVADVAYQFGLDRMVPVLIADGYTHSQLRTQFAGLVESNPLAELARRLLASPDASRLRAPAQRRRKLSTAELMDTDIGDLT